MWNKFLTRQEEIKHITGDCNYGACFGEPEGVAEGEFEYVACWEVTDTNNIPEGMVVRQVPAYRYAVFTHKGKLDTLADTYNYIYETWLPQSGEEVHPDKFDMEPYDDRFIQNSDDSEFDILVALKE
jgi:AraC family transcriptional regulator